MPVGYGTEPSELPKINHFEESCSAGREDIHSRDRHICSCECNGVVPTIIALYDCNTVNRHMMLTHTWNIVIILFVAAEHVMSNNKHPSR